MWKWTIGDGIFAEVATSWSPIGLALIHPKVHTSLGEVESFSMYLGIADVSTLPPGEAAQA
ncbi:unnamed protein product [Prunus armeniaca]|uniref:Uncharacterized protein n=1 Tax=Prunus armeniaca TaxID=36596 RepID=A0A6J5TZ70_PRUAR|nr:unnamed protein product [Prunus armeniaca]CAB4298974.1 unnamed protein product [Prunus armeniaca]